MRGLYLYQACLVFLVRLRPFVRVVSPIRGDETTGEIRFDNRRRLANNIMAAGMGRFRPTLGLSPGRFFFALVLLLGQPCDHVGKASVGNRGQRLRLLYPRGIH